MTFVRDYVLRSLGKATDADFVEEVYRALQEEDCLPLVNVDPARQSHYVCLSVFLHVY